MNLEIHLSPHPSSLSVPCRVVEKTVGPVTARNELLSLKIVSYNNNSYDIEPHLFHNISVMIAKKMPSSCVSNIVILVVF